MGEPFRSMPVFRIRTSYNFVGNSNLGCLGHILVDRYVDRLVRYTNFLIKN